MLATKLITANDATVLELSQLGVDAGIAIFDTADRDSFDRLAHTLYVRESSPSLPYLPDLIENAPLPRCRLTACESGTEA